jgi:mRNA interferase RelE/StbE
MKEYKLDYLPEAERDLSDLDNSLQIQIRKGLNKVLQNPLPKSEGGYGNPLGNKDGIDLTGCMKIKFLKIGQRVVYKLVKTESIMRVIVISTRADDEVYIEAAKRIKKYNL